MPFIINFITFGVILLAGISCVGSKNLSEYSITRLQSAPEKAEIQDTTVTLSCYLWRDFMPVSPPDGKPLRAVITLLPSGVSYLPVDLDAEKIWIIHNGEVWSDSLQWVGNPGRQVRLTQLEKMASNGPKWGPGVTVTVVVQLRDAAGTTSLLKAEQQMIHRTD